MLAFILFNGSAAQIVREQRETGNFSGVKRPGEAVLGGMPKGRGDQAFETPSATGYEARR